MCRAHMECPGPHTLETQFIEHIIEESIRVRCAHAKAHATLLKSPPVPKKHDGQDVQTSKVFSLVLPAKMF